MTIGEEIERLRSMIEKHVEQSPIIFGLEITPSLRVYPSVDMTLTVSRVRWTIVFLWEKNTWVLGSLPLASLEDIRRRPFQLSAYIAFLKIVEQILGELRDTDL